MTKYTFDWDSSDKKLRSLMDAFLEFRKGEPSTSTALFLASEAWHLIDWVYHEFNSIHGFHTLEQFRDYLYPGCPSLKIMHDIATASKHLTVSRPKSNITSTKRHEGTYSSIYYDNKYYDTTRLEIHSVEGDLLDFDMEIEKVINFWKSYFIKTLNVPI
jgi:hypothetical protein